MKLVSLFCSIMTVVAMASAASPRMGKRRSAAAPRHDGQAHRMLKKRASRFATGHGQGTIQGRMEFISLQDSVVGKHLAMRRAAAVKPKKLRHHHKHHSKHHHKKVTRTDKASVFEECDDGEADDTVSNASVQPSTARIAKVKHHGNNNPNGSSNQSSANNSSSGASSNNSSSTSNSSSGASSSSNSSDTGSSNGTGTASPSNNQTAQSTTDITQASAQTSGQGQGQVFSGGIATWFTQNGVAGACGTVHPDSALIVALPTPMYNNGALCGQQILVTDVDTGATSTATVADECPTCGNPNSLDCSQGLFTKFSTLSQGTFNVKWQLLN